MVREVKVIHLELISDTVQNGAVAVLKEVVRATLHHEHMVGVVVGLDALRQVVNLLLGDGLGIRILLAAQVYHLLRIILLIDFIKDLPSGVECDLAHYLNVFIA